MKTFIRSFQFAGTTFVRNIWLSVATVLVLLLTLFMISTIALLNILTESAIEVVEDKIDLSVYLDPDITSSEIEVVRQQIEARPEADSVRFVSKEEALQEFRSQYSDNALVQSALEELDNPLQASFIVKAHTPADYSTLARFFEEDRFDGLVESVSLQDNRKVVERLAATTDLLSKAAGAVSLLFAMIALIIVYNTIRLSIYTQKNEFEIMKLVGASRFLIRSPMVIVGALYGLIAAAISTAALYPVATYLGNRASSFLGKATIDVGELYIANLHYAFAAQAIIGVLLASMSSFVAIRRYMK